MSFLTVNGVDVPVAMSWKGVDAPIGDDVRAFSGRLLSRRRAVARSWDVKTPPLSFSEAEAIRALVMGYGDAWSFDADLYSGKGLAGWATAGPAYVSFGQSTAQSKFGGGSALLVTNGGGAEAYADINNYPLAAGVSYTLCGWIYSALTTGVAELHAYERNAANAVVADHGSSPAVPNTSTWTFVSLTGTAVAATTHLTLRLHAVNTPNGDVHYDDLTFIPAALTTTQLTAIQNHGKAFTPPPDVLVEGDMVGGEAVLCRAADLKMDDAPHYNASWQAAGRTLTFTLKERL